MQQGAAPIAQVAWMSNMKCHKCSKEVKTKPTAHGERLPKGWKRHNEQTHCDKCWRTMYVLRAITIPVVRPLGEGIGWPQFGKAIDAACEDMRNASNWMMTEIFVRDTKRKKGEKKMPKIYLYPDAVKKFPSIPTQSLAALENSVKSKYSAKRRDVIFFGTASLPSFRFPLPMAVPNQGWTASYEDAGKDGGDKVPCVSVAVRKGERFLLQLKQGREFGRQLSQLRQITEGLGVQGELAIMRKDKKVMVKMVAWLPRVERDVGERTMILTTDPNAFLVADIPDSQPWILNADHVRRRVAQHRVFLQRISEDTKYEKRWPKEKREQINNYRQARCDKQNRFLNDWVKQSAALVAKYASRQRVGEIIFDASCKSYLESFPWFMLEQTITNRCDQEGISVVLRKSKEAA